jgi:hypothetical protein
MSEQTDQLAEIEERLSIAQENLSPADGGGGRLFRCEG